MGKYDKLSEGFPSYYTLWWSKNLETTDPTPMSPQHLTQSWTNPTCVQLFKENLAWVENWTCRRKNTWPSSKVGLYWSRTFSLPYDSECANTKPPPAYFKINLEALEQGWRPFLSRFKTHGRKVLPVASHIFPQKSGRGREQLREGLRVMQVAYDWMISVHTLLSTRPLASYFATFCLDFPICKVGIIIMPTLQGCCED